MADRLSHWQREMVSLARPEVSLAIGGVINREWDRGIVVLPGDFKNDLRPLAQRYSALPGSIAKLAEVLDVGLNIRLGTNGDSDMVTMYQGFWSPYKYNPDGHAAQVLNDIHFSRTLDRIRANDPGDPSEQMQKELLGDSYREASSMSLSLEDVVEKVLTGDLKLEEAVKGVKRSIVQKDPAEVVVNRSKKAPSVDSIDLTPRSTQSMYISPDEGFHIRVLGKLTQSSRARRARNKGK